MTVCGAPTANGRPCRRRVTIADGRCSVHQYGDEAAESGADRRATPPAAVVELARGATFKAAAAAAGMGERTLRERWHDDAGELRSEVMRLRADMLGRAVGLLADLLDEATETLSEVMRDSDAAPGARVSAARAVLTVSADLFDLHDLTARMEALERLEADRSGNG